MQTKKCTDCGGIKPYSEYGRHKRKKDGLRHACKPCTNKRKKAYRRTKQGVITMMYGGQRGSSKYRNHPYPTYSRNELKEWAFSQSIFHELFDKWVESGYDMYAKPSFDRLDDYKPYTLENLRIVTWRENKLKGYQDQINGINNKHNKSVNQYSLSGEFIQSFYSQRRAARETGIQSQNINKCCSGKRNHAGGFVWKLAST
jgi:hypothetical protein